MLQTHLIATPLKANGIKCSNSSLAATNKTANNLEERVKRKLNIWVHSQVEREEYC